MILGQIPAALSRPVFAVLAVAVAAVCAYIIIQPASQGFTTRLTIEYAEIYRGLSDSIALPALSFRGDTTNAALVLLVPPAETPEAVKHAVVLRSPDGGSVRIPGEYKVGGNDSRWDTVSVVLEKEQFESGGDFTITVERQGEVPCAFEISVRRDE